MVAASQWAQATSKKSSAVPQTIRVGASRRGQVVADGHGDGVVHGGHVVLDRLGHVAGDGEGREETGDGLVGQGIGVLETGRQGGPGAAGSRARAARAPARAPAVARS